MAQRGVSQFSCPLPESLRSAKKYINDGRRKTQHYFLQKLTSRLNQGASYQYSRVNMSSVTWAAASLRVRVQ